ncbi:hypothetical protein LMG29542_08240 [Paraburkholderia humisilvae]|uniref:Core-binding (CB) domain-containing protein n=1 Tax=Paraburkholderia humisilvae TaxID=627669 RepID=A0A6J5F7H9_9BURK|nr:hypothetical protein LMG29542_08240 [Paraburkholderia humisilvae]
MYNLALSPPCTPAMNSPASAFELMSSFLLLLAPEDRDSANRARDSNRRIAADTDSEAISHWLAKHKRSRNTLCGYRSEEARLPVWSTRELGKPLPGLTREVFSLSERFPTPTVSRLDQCHILVTERGQRVIHSAPDAVTSRPSTVVMR